MGHKPDREAINAHTIEVLIEDNNLNQALALLKTWVDTPSSPYRKEVILLKSRHTEICQADRSGIMTFAKILRLKTKLKSDILDLLYAMLKA
jgi:Effector-associated domain 11